jgi:hypothetical protein
MDLMDGVAAPPTAPQPQQYPKINLSERDQRVKMRPSWSESEGSYRTPQSVRVRKCIEAAVSSTGSVDGPREAFGWIKTVGGLRQTKLKAFPRSTGFHLRDRGLRSCGRAKADRGGDIRTLPLAIVGRARARSGDR